MTDAPRLRLAHLYPDVMNVYGDRGNVIALRHRCEARGIALEVSGPGIGDAFDPAGCDLLVIGGGEDREQRRVAPDLAAKGPAIRAAIEEGMPALAVCGGFQLFGERYLDADGGTLPGIGLFRMETRHAGAGTARATGNVLIRTEFGEAVGFENHGGRTWLAQGQAPFGTVAVGRGNNGADGTEGARTANAIGTYLHGSLLPRNPAVADFLLGPPLSSPQVSICTSQNDAKRMRGLPWSIAKSMQPASSDTCRTRSHDSPPSVVR